MIEAEAMLLDKEGFVYPRFASDRHSRVLIRGRCSQLGIGESAAAHSKQTPTDQQFAFRPPALDMHT